MRTIAKVIAGSISVVAIRVCIFTASSNRITGASYDSAGNLLSDGIYTYAFNGENKIRTINSQAAYVYNGDGQRVRKLLGENRRFIYGIGGELLSEFDGASGALRKEYIYGASGLAATIEPTAVNANGTRYATADHLGSPRVITNSSASVVSRHDYMPFGEELGVGVGGRTGGMGFGVADGVRQKFTLKERDIETGLDYFLARYYSSTQGRFTSADDFLNDTHITDPASWNLYTYVRNNPLKFVDPLGQDIEETQNKKHKLTKDQKKAIEKDLQAKTGLSSIHFDKNGKLTYDPNEKANGGSAQLRQSITGAIDDSKNVFQIGDYSGSENIQFAQTDAGATTTSNPGVTTYQVKIDFADLRDARNVSDSQALGAFSLGLNLYHEIDHKVSYDSSNPIPTGMATRPDISPGPGIPGVIDNVNVARSQLGLATRAPGAHTGQRYNGPDARLKNTYQIEFNASGKAKFLRWKLENQR